MAKKALKKSPPATKRAVAPAPAKSVLAPPARKSVPVAAKNARPIARSSRPVEPPRPATNAKVANNAKVTTNAKVANNVKVANKVAGSAKVKSSARRSERGVAREPQNPMPPVIIPQRPVPTDGKPRKNQAGLTPRELEHYRELLLAKRRELVGDMSSMEREALRSAQGSNLSNLPLHMADMGTDNYEQEFTLGLVEKDRQLLREINRALAKIQDGTYGICEGTGKPITKPRLEAQPWAKYSIEYARQMERGMLRR